MEDIRKQDPTYTNFVPKTAAEAVDRYVRCRRNGLKPMLVPECLIACAAGLTGTELDNFEAWIINPNGDLDNVELVQDDSVRLYNEAIYLENLERFEAQPTETPPLPFESGEEDEKVDEFTEAVRDKLNLSAEARSSTPATLAANRHLSV